MGRIYIDDRRTRKAERAHLEQTKKMVSEAHERWLERRGMVAVTFADRLCFGRPKEREER